MDELKQLAAKLEVLRWDPQASMSYDMFAGGLKWSDERPDDWEECVRADGSPDFVGLGEYRALINYRSSLIQGSPREKFKDLWDRALQLCPNWPAFLPERRDPSLAAILREKSEAAIRSWEEADERFRAAQVKPAKVNA